MKQRRGPKDTFDGWFNALVTAHAEALRLCHLAKRNLEAARGQLYDVVKAYYTCQERFHNELLAQVRTREATLEEWTEALFAPFEAFAEPRRKIKEAIDAGMTRKQFVQQHSAAWLLERFAGKRNPKEHAAHAPDTKCVIPPEPESGLSSEEVAARWRARSLAQQATIEQLLAELREHKKIVREMKQNIALAVEHNRRLLRGLEPLDSAGARR